MRKNEDVFSSTTLRISNSKESPIKDIIWQRRGGGNFNPKEIYKTETIDFLNSEQNSVEDSIEKIHKGNNYLGGFYEEKHHEKIYDLYLAKSVGIKVPETLVTNEKTSLLAFFKDYKKIITKAIKNPFNYIDDEFIYSSGKTLLVNQNDIDNLDEYFAISKFQEYIEKELEIRIFFFDGSFFEMCKYPI
ncbi:hypothetical protein M2T82_18540, partial [Elizabethkingia ursingii]|uniref:hypothetical protein n=1 Tax=Elizabethkingia ursingii TaxID=1756150 RepID=UPI00201180F5